MSEENVFTEAPTGSGKTMRGIFTVEDMEQERTTEDDLHTAIPGDGGYETGRAEEKFGSVQGGKEVLELTGETSADLRLLKKAGVVICTPNQVGFSSSVSHLP